MRKGFLASIPISSTTVFDYLVISTLVVAVIFYYYYKVAVKKPRIHCGNEKLKRFLRNHVPLLDLKYWPSFCYFEGRLQTIFGLTKRLSKCDRLMYQREVLTMKDGQQVGLDFLPPPVEQCHDSDEDDENTYNNPNNENSLVVLIMPAFASSSQTAYIKSLALSIVNSGGATAAVLNYRGFGGVPLSTPKMISATNCDDLREVIAHLRQKFPNSKIMAVGTSIGGIILGHYLVDHAEEARETLCAVALISIIWDAWSSRTSIESPMNLKLVNEPLAQMFIKQTKRYQKVLENQDDFSYAKFASSKTIRQLDENYVVPQFGYKSLEDYYNHITLAKDVDKFNLPVFALNAEDDPLQPGKDLPIKPAENSTSNTALIVTCRGGHLGFLEGLFPKMKPMHFMEKLVGQLVEGVRLHGTELNIQKSH